MWSTYRKEWRGKVQHCGGEHVIAIARHHVGGVGDVDECGVRDERQQLAGRLRGHHVAAAPAHQQARHRQPLGPTNHADP